jgi:hypothetical protein
MELEVAGRPYRLRKANAADYDQVLQLSTKMYNGLDYMSVWFQPLLNMPNARVYLMESIEDGVITSLCVLIVDSSKTAVHAGSARTHPAFEGQGMITTLMFCLIGPGGLLMEEFPRLKKLLITQVDERRDDHPGVTKLMRWVSDRK